MKTRLFICIFALFGLVAASCGSDADVEEVAEAADPVAESAAPSDDEDAVEVEEATPADDEEATPADDEAMADDEEALEDEEAMAADEGSTERIVSLSPTATEMLFAIGAGDQVVAVDSFSYFPEEAPVTDLSGFDPNIEAIAGFEPDIVVSSFPLEGIDAIGAENYVVPAAVDLGDIYAQIEQLGARTGNIGGAAELVLQMQIDIDAILASVPKRDTPLTYFHELDNTLYSVTSETFIGYVYDLFGLVNIADAADGAAGGYPQVSEEFILTADPDLIFLADTLCCEQSVETVAARPGWDQLTAVQNGNVIEMNDDIVSRWGPRMVDFVAAVGAAVNELQPVPAS